MFESLTDKIESAFSFFNRITRLDEKQADEGLRKIRQALLESDVSLSVAKDFINNVKPKIIGQEVLKSVTPGQMIVKIVFDELVSILGDEKKEINLNAVPPVKILVVGLQGSGKTTTTAKLAKYIEKNYSKKSMLVSLDIYRPAAQKQLEVLGEKNSIKTLPIIEGQFPLEISKRGNNTKFLICIDLWGIDILLLFKVIFLTFPLKSIISISQILGKFFFAFFLPSFFSIDFIFKNNSDNFMVVLTYKTELIKKGNLVLGHDAVS